MTQSRIARDLDVGRLLHDLKAPVRAMRAFAEALEEDYGDRLDEEGREYLGYISSGAENLRAMIDAIAAYCGLDDKPVHLSPVDLTACIEGASASLAADLTSEKYVVETDRFRLQLAVAAAVENAVKFVPAGGNARIGVSCSAAEDAYVIAVRDEGIGVPAADRERAFEPFVQLNPQGEFSGVGMGLAIAKRAMRQIGGDMRFTETDGPGATLEIVVASKPSGL